MTTKASWQRVRSYKRKPSKILRLAADRITGRRFMRGDFYDVKRIDELGPDDVKVCAWGAIKWASYGTPAMHTMPGSPCSKAFQYAELAIRKGYDPVSHGLSLPAFNDSHKMPEVRKMLLAAADLAEADGE